MQKFILLVGILVAFISMTGCGGTVETISSKNSAKISASSDVKADVGDWPWWRGPSFNSATDSQDVPVKWNSQNTKWKISVPGRGHASPIVVGDKVLIATSNKSKQTQSLIAYSRTDGSELWNTQLHSGKFMRMHGTNTHASATPASDGKHIFTAFIINNGLQVSAIDLEGEIKWQKTAGPFVSRHGYGSSPLIYKSIIIVNGDNDGGGFIAALNRDDGEIVWRIARPNNGSYCSPVVAKIDGKDQLLVSGNNAVISYDPSNGNQLWKSNGPARTTANTLIWNDEFVFSSGGYPEKSVMAIKADGSGKVAWQKRIKMYVPSPLMIGDKLLVTQDSGLLRLLNASDGNEIWKHRLEADFYGSPVLNGDTVFIGGRNGKAFAFKVEPEFKLVAQSQLDGDISTTPAICKNEIFVRTTSSLYCFSNAVEKK